MTNATYTFDHAYPTGTAGHVIYLMGETLGSLASRCASYGYGYGPDDSDGIFPEGATVEEVCCSMSVSYNNGADIVRHGFADGTAILLNRRLDWFQQENPDFGTATWDFDPIANPSPN